ncbi:MAG: hypothetical protein KDB53_10985, partial [Planctomycetes bacterium]|nr:hypothetical protein [Planctomycetota bacterium]
MKTTSLLVLAFGLILSTSAFAQYPGTGEDLNLTSAVNFAPLTGGPLNQSKTAAAGDLVTLHFESPNGAFIGNNFSLLATVFSSSGPSVPEVAPSTFPKIYANLSAPFPFFTVSVLGSGSIQNLGVPFILPPGGV